jgi:hypothetical protein
MRDPKQTHHYQGYRIHVNQNGSKWQATIYPPKSSVAATEVPSSRDDDGDEKVLAEARQIIDARIAVNA